LYAEVFRLPAATHYCNNSLYHYLANNIATDFFSEVHRADGQQPRTLPLFATVSREGVSKTESASAKSIFVMSEVEQEKGRERGGEERRIVAGET
jgi:hypothetical protein